MMSSTAPNSHKIPRAKWRSWSSERQLAFNDIYERFTMMSLCDLLPPGVLNDVSGPEIRKTLVTLSVVASATIDRMENDYGKCSTQPSLYRY